jgi:hypothetical protein
MPAIFYCNEILNLLQEYFRFFKDLFPFKNQNSGNGKCHSDNF